MKIDKAGVIPFIRTERGIEMAFMISSNATYGGDRPMIAKGHVDKGETPDQAAVREGEEELGLLTSNLASPPFHLTDSRIRGYHKWYTMRTLAVEVKSKDDFGPFCSETKEVVWLTAEEFTIKGRDIHKGIVNSLIDVLEAVHEQRRNTAHVGGQRIDS